MSALPEMSLTRDDPLFPPRECAAYRAAGIRKMRILTGFDAWVVPGYEQIRTLATDPRISSDLHGLGTVSHERIPSRGEHDAPHITNLDGADHRRLRGPVARHFTAKRVRELEESITETVRECVSTMIAKGPGVDLVAELGLPVPAATICGLFGLPREDVAMFDRLARTALGGFAASDEEKATSGPEIFRYLSTVIADKRDNPDEALFADLLHGGFGFTETEVLILAGTLLVAGYDTTAHMISLGSYALLRNREQWDTLRADPSIVDNLVEELLRHLSVMQRGLLRRATEPIELDGVRIEADDLVLLFLPAGNHDADFVPEPSTLDVTRKPGRHLAFGYGAHLCAGQQLAKMELRTVFRELVTRLPGLHIAPHAAPRFRDDSVVYGIEELPVTW